VNILALVLSDLQQADVVLDDTVELTGEDLVFQLLQLLLVVVVVLDDLGSIFTEVVISLLLGSLLDDLE